MTFENTMTVEEMKNYYKALSSYQELRALDQQFFDIIFLSLFVNRIISLDNQVLARRFNQGLSTIEKRCRRLENAHLIRREYKNYVHGSRIRTFRTIYLDEFTFPGMQLVKN